jgi:hypothetical protein
MFQLTLLHDAWHRNSSFLGNGSVNIFQWKRTGATIKEAVFSVGAAQLGHPLPGVYKYGDPALQVGGVSSLRQQNRVMSPEGLGPENECAGVGQQQLWRKDYDRECSVEKYWSWFSRGLAPRLELELKESPELAVGRKIRRNGMKGIRLCKEDFIFRFSDSETYKSVARIRLVKTEKTACPSDLQSV